MRRTGGQLRFELISRLSVREMVSNVECERSRRPAAEFHPGQGAATLMSEWERSASGSLQRPSSPMDEFHSLTPGAIAMRRLRHLRRAVGWIRKL